jgi:hypothetical protein
MLLATTQATAAGQQVIRLAELADADAVVAALRRRVRGTR